MERITVVLVDDHPIVRKGIRRILEKDQNIQVTYEAATGQEGLTCILEQKPTVAVLDIELPDMMGYEVAQRVRNEAPDQKILALSAHNNSHYVLKMIASGASGYLLKNEAPRSITTAVRAVANGERSWLSPHVRRSLGENKAGAAFIQAIDASKDQAESVTDLNLTEQERQVLVWLAAGKNNHEIADVTRMPLSQVDSMVEALIQKVGGITRLETAARAIHENLI